MAVSDSVGDMLTMIRNASSAKKDAVEVKKSKLAEAIIAILKKEGFVSEFRAIPDNKQGLIRVYLKYGDDRTPVIIGLKRISKPSRRVYKAKDKIPFVRGGIGIAIVSTSQGLLTDKEARASGLGGEVICYAW